MRKTKKLLLLALSILLLASCGFDMGGGSYQAEDYIYIRGTARLDPETMLYGFDSARIFLSGRDITAELEPADPKALDGKGDIVDNVIFMYPTGSYSIGYESKSNDGYEFGEWKVRQITDLVAEDDIRYETYSYRTALEGIEDARNFLDTPSLSDSTLPNRYSENPDRFRHDILPYIYPEYNRAAVCLALVEEGKLPEGYEWNGNGSLKAPYSLEEFRESNRDRQEINVLVRVKDTPINNDLSKFFIELNNKAYYPELEEIHIKLANRDRTNADIGSLLDRFDYVELSDMEFGNINLTESKTEWKFINCHFDSLTVATDQPVTLEECSCDSFSKMGSTDVTVR